MFVEEKTTRNKEDIIAKLEINLNSVYIILKINNEI